MIVGALEIQLAADVARISADMRRAQGVVDQATTAMGRAASIAKGALGAIAGVLSVNAFAGWIKGAIDATDAASDISQSTGVAVKDLAGLQLWFQKGGMEAGAFETSMVKLSKEIAEGADAFQRLGIHTRNADGSLRSNVDVLMDSADAFAKMQDGTAKTALAMELFSKTGANLIPMLNEGSQGLRDMVKMADELGLTFNQKTVDAAGSFNDTLDFMGLAAQGVGRQVAAQLLPTLNSLSGSLLNFIVKSDGVRKAADVIGTGFKIIYTAGVSVMTLFDVLGKIIGGSMAFIANNLGTLFLGLKQAIEGNYSDAWRTITSGGVGAATILTSTFNDVKNSMSAAATTISDVWTGAGGDSVAALAGMQDKSKHLTDEERKRAAKAIEAAEDFIKAQQKEREAIGLNDDQQRMLTASRAAAVAPTQKQRVAIMANALAITTERQAWEKSEAARKAAEDAIGQDAQTILDLQERARGLELEVQLHGKTAEAAVMAEAAKVRAKAGSLAISEEYREQLIKEADELDRIAKLQGKKEALDASSKAAQKAAEDWKRASESIEQSLTDALLRGFESGKSFGRNLIDTLKNMFATLVLRPQIQAMLAPMTGNLASMLPGSAGGGQAGGFGSAAQTASNLYGMYKTGSSAGAAASAMDNGGTFSGLNIGAQVSQYMPMIATAVAAYYAGSAVANGYKVGGTGLANVLNSFGIVGGLVNRAFGMKDKVYSDTSNLVGSIGSGGFSGDILTAWTQKGGWFRSDKSGTTPTPVGADLSKELAAGYKAIKDASADFAKTLGINADYIADRAQAVNIALGKDEAANHKAIADFFVGVGNTIASELLPSLSQFQQEGEEASATLQRLATGYALIDTALESIGMSFGAVGTASIEARERLLTAAGGMDAFAANVAGFQQNFLTEQERNAPVLKAVTEQMAALGHASIDTREEFKALWLSLNPADEADGKLLASLSKIQAAFAQVYPAIDSVAIAAEKAAAVLQERNALQEEYDGLTMSSSELLARQRSALDESNRALFDQIQAVKAQQSAAEEAAAAQAKAAEVIKAAQERAAAASQAWGQGIVDVWDRTMRQTEESLKSLKEFSNSLLQGDLSGLDPDARYREAKKQFETVGDTKSMQAFLQASKERGVDDFYYQRDFAVVQEALAKQITSTEAYLKDLPRMAAAWSYSSTPAYIAQISDAIVPPVTLGSSTMSSSRAQQVDVSKLEAKVDGLIEKLGGSMEVVAASTASLAEQFDRVSNGGQKLATEVG